MVSFKSHQGNSEGTKNKDMILIFVFFSEFIRDFKISKNWNVQALGDSTFGDGTMMKDLTMGFKKLFFVFFGPFK